jgi:hypothetical protein
MTHGTRSHYKGGIYATQNIHSSFCTVNGISVALAASFMTFELDFSSTAGAIP